MNNIGSTVIGQLEFAYNFYNDKIFEGSLPNECIMLIGRQGKSKMGHFMSMAFSPKDWDGISKVPEEISEIVLNSDSFCRRDVHEILGTIVHEMVHFWHFIDGDAPSNGHHDKKWGKMMEEIGLMPSASGREGGKRTGKNMSHYVIPGGIFENATRELVASGYKIDWQGIPAEKISSSKNKVKYSCRSCNSGRKKPDQIHVWGKPNMAVVCGICMDNLVSDSKQEG